MANRFPVTNGLGAVLALLTVAVGMHPSGMGAQTAADPFLDEPSLLVMAYALEKLDLRLTALGSTELTPELARRIGRDVPEDLRLFAGSLEEREPALVVRLTTALDRSIDAAMRGRGPLLDEEIHEARTRLREARQALLPPENLESPSFLGGVTALLLLGKDGVADGFEDAGRGDAGAHALGRAALDRSETLWTEIRPLASEVSEETRFEIDDMLQSLHALYASSMPPAMHSGDPEDAEAPAHRIVGFLEQATGTPLYPSRDFGRLAAVIRDVTLDGCEAFRQDRNRVGTQRTAVAQLYYGQYLRRTLDLLAPSLHQEVGALFLRILEEGPEREEAVPTCRRLAMLLDEARSILGG